MIESQLTPGQSLASLKNEMSAQLVRFGIELEEALTECDMMIEHILGLSRSAQLAALDALVDDVQLTRLMEMIDARRLRMPIQYILGEAYFMGLKLKVRSGVFIPRPDTETVVECVIEKMKGVRSPSKALEIGVGSGAIAISLLKNLDELEVVAVDASPVALETTAENAATHGVSERLTLFREETWWTVSDKFQLLVSNPPYIPRHQTKDLQPEVGLYEPELALFGTGEDGLGFYRDIASNGCNVLDANGAFVVVEVGDHQAKDVAAIFANAGFLDVECLQDLTGMERVVSCRFGSVS
ncbi:MAG: peptide chain release factor N(5)-glutamine methyltransferase [Candidatus Obscuribacterales bacterium]|nr:peptide chain release factor N(5)-glutamine methyltransferase [Candidatus Obscuribacterales bacterium]